MDPVQVRPHPAVCVKSLVPVIRFFFPRMLDFGGRQVHRQVDARAEHGRRPTEFALPNRVLLDLRHRMLDALPVVVDPRVDCHHCPVENLPSCQAEPGEHTEAPDKEQETRKSNPRTLHATHNTHHKSRLHTRTPNFSVGVRAWSPCR